MRMRIHGARGGAHNPGEHCCATAQGTQSGSRVGSPRATIRRPTPTPTTRSSATSACSARSRHRRVGRRSERDHDVFRRRRAPRLRDAVGGAGHLPLMAAVQLVCARIGLVTGHGLAGAVRRHYPRPFLYAACLLLLVANVFNITADLAGMADATHAHRACRARVRPRCSGSPSFSSPSTRATRLRRP